MIHRAPILNRYLVLALCGYVTFAQPSQAQDVDVLLEQLRTAEPAEANRLANEISERWSKSGSASFDLLLMRGREALEDEEYEAAIEHLTALTDHAPDFAEGWNARATAFYMVEEFGLAIEDIARVLTLNPDHFGALSGLGAILQQLDQDEAALRAFEAALAIHPHLEDVSQAAERLRDRTSGTSL